MKIIYIAGYGRSGSTILDVILGSHEEIVSLGEVANLHQLIAESGPLGCSCGNLLTSCPFWSGVVDRLPLYTLSHWRSVSQTIRNIESIGSLARLTRGEFQAGGRKEEVGLVYRDQLLALFDAVQATSKAQLALDSSKTTWLTIGRPLALSRVCGLDVKIIHLVRDGQAVMWSGMKGSNKRLSQGDQRESMVRGYKTALGWASVNLLTSLMLRSFPRRDVIRVHYEEFVENPASTIAALQAFLEIDLSRITSRIVQGYAFAAPHLVAGNRVALNSRIRLRADYEWRKRLPRSSRWFYWLFLWPIALYYGRCNG